MFKKGKLRTYFEYLEGKHIYHKSIAFQYWKSLTQCRISVHQLAIETGRYKNIDTDKWLCGQCKNMKVEDEIHFLKGCTAYEQQLMFFLMKQVFIVNSMNNLFGWSHVILKM